MRKLPPAKKEKREMKTREIDIESSSRKTKREPFSVGKKGPADNSLIEKSRDTFTVFPRIIAVPRLITSLK